MNMPVKMNQNYEFRRVYKKGLFKAHPLLVTYVFKTGRGFVRYGITATKKVGKALERNRARRVIEAAARENIPNLKGSFDIVFVARAKTPAAKSQEVSRIMQKQLSLIAGGEEK